MRLTYAVIIILLALMTSVQCQQTAEDWFNKGVALYEQNEYDKAIEAFDEAIKQDPENAEAWFNKGIALSDLDEGDKANEAFDEAIKLDPEYVEAWEEKSGVLFYQGKYDEAADALDEIIKKILTMSMPGLAKARPFIIRVDTMKQSRLLTNRLNWIPKLPLAGSLREWLSIIWRSTKRLYRLMTKQLM